MADFGWAISLALVLIFWRSLRKLGRWESVNWRGIVPVSLNEQQREILSRNFVFYNKLPSQSKSIFEYRVARFIQSKNFVPRSLKTVTMEMKVCIAAAAIQLTFGLPKIYLTHFKNILIYPDQYYSTITRQFHHGEVNPRLKAIVLSWKNFVAGYSTEEGVNLGLHEMAHALFLENYIRNDEFAFLPKEALAAWDELAMEEMEKIVAGNAPAFFRKYASENTHEFFAVAVENFFERPEEFYRYHPKLFALLCQILNQNPLLLQV